MNVKKEKIFEYYNKDTLNIRDKKIRKLKKKWDRIIKIPTNFEYELDLNIEYSEKIPLGGNIFVFLKLELYYFEINSHQPSALDVLAPKFKSSKLIFLFWHSKIKKNRQIKTSRTLERFGITDFKLQQSSLALYVLV